MSVYVQEVNTRKGGGRPDATTRRDVSGTMTMQGHALINEESAASM